MSNVTLSFLGRVTLLQTHTPKWYRRERPKHPTRCWSTAEKMRGKQATYGVERGKEGKRLLPCSGPFEPPPQGLRRSTNRSNCINLERFFSYK